MVTGTPCRRPVLLRDLSAARAAFRASSERSTTTALSFGLTSAMRAICASVTSTEETAPERIAAAVSTADHCQTGPFGRRGFAAAAFADNVGCGLALGAGFFTAALAAARFGAGFAVFAAFFTFAGFFAVFAIVVPPVIVSGHRHCQRRFHVGGQRADIGRAQGPFVQVGLGSRDQSR